MGSLGLTDYSDLEGLGGNGTEGHRGDVDAVDTGILSLVFRFYCREFKIRQVEDRVAECWLRISGGHVRLCQIEETSRISGMSRASDGEAAALGDGYFVRAVDHHRMRRCQGDGGRFQIHCRMETGF